ncbi:MAG: AbrB/MazE/SpoVT family DNA-binding domain-containing protein [Gemmatimonadota bacterium]
MSQATLTTKGQVTIPKAVRVRLHLKAGDRLDFIVNDAGEAVIRRVSRTAQDVRGMLAHRARLPLSVEQLDEAVRRRFETEQP